MPAMSVGRICVRTVHVAGPGESAREAARRMVTEGVGTLVVLGGDRRPVGFVTDRDVMFHCVAEGRDAARTKVEEIMAVPVVTVPGDAAVAGVATLGYAGFLAGPPLLGWLAEPTSLRVVMAVVVCLAAVTAILAPAVRIAAKEG